MPHPTPATPTNVQHSNPYSDLSRGLFLIRNPESAIKFARVHAANWVSKGPAAGIGHLQFQLMGYATQPSTAAQYAAGALMDAPDGTKWFDCLTRGLVTKPIMVEYWATNIFYNHYVEEDADKLSQEEIDNAMAMSKSFVETIGKPVNITDVDFTVAFNAVAGQPLTRTSMMMSVDFKTPAGVADHMDIADFPSVDFDPLQLALRTVRNLRE